MNRHRLSTYTCRVALRSSEFGKQGKPSASIRSCCHSVLSILGRNVSSKPIISSLLTSAVPKCRNAILSGNFFNKRNPTRNALISPGSLYKSPCNTSSVLPQLPSLKQYSSPRLQVARTPFTARASSIRSPCTGIPSINTFARNRISSCRNRDTAGSSCAMVCRYARRGVFSPLFWRRKQAINWCHFDDFMLN